MKKSLLTPVLLFSLTLIISCSSDSDDDLDPTPTPTNVTYNTNIKPIMDSNCVSCHGSPVSNGAPMSLTTLTQVQQAITSRNLIGRVENGTMPPNGNLSAAQIQALKDWQTEGFPQ